HVDGLRRLTTNTGAFVLGGAKPITIRAGVPEDGIAIAPDGTVNAGGRRVGRLDLVTVRDPEALTSVGDNAFVVNAASGNAVPAPRATTLTQGALEMSNVDMA